MKITSVKIYPNKDKSSKLKAYASITLDDVFVVNGVKLFDGQKGKFVSMPASKDEAGEWHDICFPLSKEFRKEIEDAVLKEYDNR